MWDNSCQLDKTFAAKEYGYMMNQDQIPPEYMRPKHADGQPYSNDEYNEWWAKKVESARKQLEENK